MDLSEARAALIDLRRRLDRLIDDLDGAADQPGRQWRNYDQPYEDPAEIEARWGVKAGPPTNEAPFWFQERFGTHTEEPS